MNHALKNIESNNCCTVNQNRKKSLDDFLTIFIKFIGKSQKIITPDDILHRKLWPVLKPIIEFAQYIKIINREQDNLVVDIIEFGENKLKSENNEQSYTKFKQNLSVLKDKIIYTVEILKLLSDDSTEEIVEKFIEIYDALSPENDDSLLKHGFYDDQHLKSESLNICTDQLLIKDKLSLQNDHIEILQQNFSMVHEMYMLYKSKYNSAKLKIASLERRIKY